MARPKRTPFEKIQTKTWFAAVSKKSGMTAYQIEQHRGDSSKAWHKYQNGEHTPNSGIINSIEKEWAGTKRIFVDGPANLFAAASADLEQGYWLFKSSRLEPGYRGVLPRFLSETQFRGAPEQGIIALADWLRKKAEVDVVVVPLAVSANLITSRLLASNGLWDVIEQGIRAFDEQYGMPMIDFLGVHKNLLGAFVDQLRRLRRPIPQWALDQDALATFGGIAEVRPKGIR